MLIRLSDPFPSIPFFWRLAVLATGLLRGPPLSGRGSHEYMGPSFLHILAAHSGEGFLAYIRATLPLAAISIIISEVL